MIWLSIFFFLMLFITLCGVIYAIVYVNFKEKTCNVVYAGQIPPNNQKPEKIDLGVYQFQEKGKKVDVSKYEFFKVVGESMSTRGINDGDGIFIETLTSKDISKLEPNISIVLKDKPSDPSSAYKLRNFLQYVSVNGFLDAVNKVKEIITDDKLFTEDDITQLQQTNVDANTEYIISSTYRSDKKQKHLSLHPINKVYGRVVYKISACDYSDVITNR